ncbi:eCIS core domain-containing protein [Pseudomonas sp. LRF_L74]|uniref:eCIS core domain-containing protein n=1 Tax=Pseudomonas sp. LRF_L74 TaxID=3369422 RepID=UPI003F5ED2B8
MPRSILRNVVLIIGLCSALPALACGPGRTEVCLGGCVCINDPNGVLGPLQEQAGGMAASALEGWILRSRAAAAREGTLPIPMEIRRRLLPFYPAQLLDGVRYKVGDNDDMSAARTMLQNPDVKAVTLVDIIVFRSREMAEHDVVLWAHELWHVQQYREWGSAEFARRYSRDFNAVEAPAYRRQIDVANVLRAQRQ